MKGHLNGASDKRTHPPPATAETSGTTAIARTLCLWSKGIPTGALGEWQSDV